MSGERNMAGCDYFAPGGAAVVVGDCVCVGASSQVTGGPGNLPLSFWVGAGQRCGCAGLQADPFDPLSSSTGLFLEVIFSAWH